MIVMFDVLASLPSVDTTVISRSPLAADPPGTPVLNVVLLSPFPARWLLIVGAVMKGPYG